MDQDRIVPTFGRRRFLWGTAALALASTSRPGAAADKQATNTATEGSVEGVKALVFDVFGTVVDWRTGVAREAKSILSPLGYSLDWMAFADAWRAEYQPAMEEVRSGRIPFSRLDVIHRSMLERIRPRFGLQKVEEPVLQELNLAWHRLDGWPDASRGLHRLRKRFLLAPVFQRQHLPDGRSRAAQRFPLGRHPRRGDRRRLQAEAARVSGRRGILRPPPRAVHDGRRPQQRPGSGGQGRTAHGARHAARRIRAQYRRERTEGAGGRCGAFLRGAGDEVGRETLAAGGEA